MAGSGSRGLRGVFDFGGGNLREMSIMLVEKLLESFDKLERCIEITRDVLAERDGVTADVVARIDQYGQIVAKQRQLADSLRFYLENRDWSEVSRHVKLINGLSSMIRDDAHDILVKTDPGLLEQKAEVPTC